ncbi:MAG TPA: glycerophosphodiester phosphodiesterase [Candidatus Saccharimonadales bacterium]|nr:glycerophosphodiester phosphodiesterase [Candidatus Saccharimonadales bacterium]
MKTLLIAHRGAVALAPENTVSAFELALQRGFRAVECDVQLSRDGHLVVIHDSTLHRLTGAQGWVSRKELGALRALRLSRGERIPTLAEAIKTVVVKHHKKLIIEIKGDSESHAAKVADALATYLAAQPGAIDRHIEVHSFWYPALLAFKRKNPHITTAAIINGGFSPQQITAIARKCQADGVSLNYEFISKKVVKACHKSGLFVDTWTAPDNTVMKRLRRFGLEAIIENTTGKAAKA